MKTLLAILSCIFCCFATVQAQEKLYLKTQKDPIECTVLEINTEEIKYKPSDAEQLVIGVSKADVVKIVFKSGRVQYFTDPLEDFNFYKGQKRWIAKLGLLSPAFGFTDLFLEKSVKPGRSIEFQGTIIGLGKNITYYNSYTSYNNLYINQIGASLGVGIKALRMPDFEVSNRKLKHILLGGYLKPSINIGYYQRDFLLTDPVTYNLTKVSKGIVTSQIAICLGKQWILDNTISIEIYGSLGLGIDNYRSQQSKIKKDYGNNPNFWDDDESLPYSNFGYTKFGRGNAGVTVSGGLKLGYLFNWKKPKKENGTPERLQKK